MLGLKKRIETCFGLSLAPSAILGTAICGLFYYLIQLPALRHEMLMRYALCHWVAIASAWLFCIACVVLVQKWIAVRRQMRLARDASHVLSELVEHRGMLNQESMLTGLQRAEGLDTLWRSQKRNLVESWFGQRVSELIDRQRKRRSTKRLDEDLRELSDRDADAQHSSYAMVRINCWAMPMLGFLGTVIGISDTLGQMDAQALASGSQEAMNNLTSGLYVAFDTTAVGLVLTMVAMFLQFAIQRSEIRLLAVIDQGVGGCMHQCLSEADEHADTRDVEASLRTIAIKLMASMEQVVQRQSELWRETIAGAHSHWLQISEGATETAMLGVRQAISESLSEHRQAMHANIEQLSQLQTEGANQIDARLQQWQTTISEQARVALRQQQELNKQTEVLEKLLDSSQLVAAMQKPIEATLERMTEVDRFHEAAIGLSEAVMVLGTQLERFGPLARQPVRRRATEAAEAHDPSSLPASASIAAQLAAVDSSASERHETQSEAVILPLDPERVEPRTPSISRKRKAG